jgi:hypothetical protein
MGATSIVAVAYGNGLYVVGTATANRAATSTDGVTWTSRSGIPTMSSILYADI